MLVTGLCDGPPGWLAHPLAIARDCGPDVSAALRIADRVGRLLPVPGGGSTVQRWSVLDELARANVAVARVVEAHADALAILAEAGADRPDGTWGVFAAEAPNQRVVASDDHGSATLSGVKPWCSLGGVLDHALVTAWTAGGARRLYAVDLHHPGVRAEPARGWVSRGLPGVTSVGLVFDRVPARPVGAPGWYLQRPGFAWGGLGVAACWFGATRGVAEALHPRADDPLRDLALGRVEVAAHAAACVLRDAASRVDAAAANGDDGESLALRVRSVVAAAADEVLGVVGRATGPAPLAFDELHAARVADLQIYLRQHHGERDLAALGARVGCDGHRP